MNLCIDIGNTRTKAALYEAYDEIEYFPHFESSDLYRILEGGQHSVIISKSGRNTLLESTLNQLKQYNLLSYKSKLPIQLNYMTPQTLGADRIASAVAASHYYAGRNVLIVDLGTCLTIDFIDQSAVFQGGLIAPGVDMRLKSMHEYTAALPLVENNDKVTFPGKSTAESLQVGAYQSVMQEIKGYINLLSEQYKDLIVVDCSGTRLHFDKEDNYQIFAHPKFVLQGLNVIANQNV